MIDSNLKKALNLEKDPNLTIFLAVESVDKKVSDLALKVASIEIPDPTPVTDLTELNSKLDSVIAKQSEPIEVELEII